MAKQTIAVLMILALFLIGCRTAPVAVIADAPINTASGKTPALSLVTKEIINAGVQLGWQMKNQKSGHMIATLYLREHMVKVDIYYSSSEYSINYKDSNNMNYDGDNIHSNYNSWVQNLSNAIRTRVYNSTN
ncbi:MAG: hypothetical protein QNL62_24100 [Gammaproteobacteria bacterium]|nr:hypothetical protein [Gammaproteobacteria bacterium]